MTTLAGAVPRMMRPGPGQNYPRSGFPLEGMLGPQPIRIPGLGIGCRTPFQVSRAWSRAFPGASSSILPIPRSNGGEGVSWRGEKPHFAFRLQTPHRALYKPSELARPARAGSTLPCFGVAVVRKVDKLRSHGSKILFTQTSYETVPAAPTFEKKKVPKLLLVRQEFSCCGKLRWSVLTGSFSMD